MEFDPLSLFTPAVSCHDEPVVVQYPASQENENGTNEPLYEDLDDHLVPLHVLDLPMLQLHPTQEALKVLLELLSPNDVYNFSGEQELDVEDINIDDVFKEKNLSAAEIESALAWFTAYCPRFNTKEKLGFIPHLSNSMKLNYESEYNGYMTRIISSDLNWISDVNSIHKLASLRISENCGRTAQPEIIRKIALPNLSNYVSDKYLRLKEPSLTNDNLGLKTWGSSLILAQRLLSHDNYLRGKVLELGSGTGLVGMVCALLGFNTYLTDLQEIIPNLQDNVKLNNIDAIVHELNWCDPSAFTDTFADITFETIVVSDPIYSSKHPQWVVNMIHKFLAPGGRVLIQIPLRPKFEQERAHLWSLMLENFVEQEVEIESGFDDFGEMKFCFKLFNHKSIH